MYQYSLKKVMLGLVSFMVFLSLFCTTTASASEINGLAKITLDQVALATLKGGNNLLSDDVDGQRYLYVNEVYEDSEFIYPTEFCTTNPSNPLFLCNATPTNFSGLALDAQPYRLPVVTAIVTPYQNGNIGTNWNQLTGGSIGIAGAFKMRSDFFLPNLSIRWGALSLHNVGSDWIIYDNLNGGSLFELTNVKTKILGNGGLQLKGDLKFGNSSWGAFFSGGILSLTPEEKQMIIGNIKVKLRN